MLFELSTETCKLFSGLSDVVSAGGEAVGEFGDAVGVRRRTSGNTFKLDS